MLWALVMAGGMGTRLWPLSRRKLPKPFLKLIPGRATLLEETVRRLSPTIKPERIFVIGNEDHLGSLRKFSPGVPKNQVMGEPVSRNTAATVALGASLILKRDSQALILILPADHWISDKKKFQKAVRSAATVSSKTKLFSIFGVPPTFPSTSYGYIRFGKKISGSVFELKQFIEKPSLSRAKTFLRSARFFWHAGIFLAPAQTILDSVLTCSPFLSFQVAKLKTQNGKIVPPKVFQTLPSISFDYAVLERLKKAHLVKGSFDWCDVGTWKSFEQLWPQDEFGNSVVGSCLALNSYGNVVYSKGKLLCLQGVKDLVAIETPDALLISRKDSAEEMRKVVLHLTWAKKNLSRYS